MYKEIASSFQIIISVFFRILKTFKKVCNICSECSKKILLFSYRPLGPWNSDFFSRQWGSFRNNWGSRDEIDDRLRFLLVKLEQPSWPLVSFIERSDSSESPEFHFQLWSIHTKAESFSNRRRGLLLSTTLHSLRAAIILFFMVLTNIFMFILVLLHSFMRVYIFNTSFSYMEKIVGQFTILPPGILNHLNIFFFCFKNFKMLWTVLIISHHNGLYFWLNSTLI